MEITEQVQIYLLYNRRWRPRRQKHQRCAYNVFSHEISFAFPCFDFITTDTGNVSSESWEYFNHVQVYQVATQVWTHSTSLGLYTSIKKKDSNAYLLSLYILFGRCNCLFHSSIGLFFEDLLESNYRSVSQDFSFLICLEINIKRKWALAGKSDLERTAPIGERTDFTRF